ncbi:hypothetical protein [Arthrobacter sp. U41]|uniref:hypothetical protein n=1 Tax=Arthrobacter sp. U41 TaxID=1849032 RepID=UPI0011A4C595|nr:hypothetical protein [Arthrobacter sp. U41]
MNNGSGVVIVCDSTVAGDTAAGVGSGLGAGAAVAVGPAVGAEVAPAVGPAVGAEVAPGVGPGVGVDDTVDVGAGVGSARAGVSVTAVSEAKVTTNAVMSAVVFRIEINLCLS